MTTRIPRLYSLRAHIERRWRIRYVHPRVSEALEPRTVCLAVMDLSGPERDRRRLFLPLSLSCVLLAGSMAPFAYAIEEPKTGTSFPDSVLVEPGPTLLTVTGVGLREKTFLKVDIYAISMHVAKGAQLEPPLDRALIDSPIPKRLELAMCRDVERDKLVESTLSIMAKNWPDTASVRTELRQFLSFFERDALPEDRLSFTWHPHNGLDVHINGELIGTVPGFEFTRALWSVWFGQHPADDGIKRDLLAGLAPGLTR